MCSIRYVSELLALVKMSHFTAKINGYFISLMPSYYHYQAAPLSCLLMTPTEPHAILTVMVSKSFFLHLSKRHTFSLTCSCPSRTSTKKMPPTITAVVQHTYPDTHTLSVRDSLWGKGIVTRCSANNKLVSWDLSISAHIDVLAGRLVRFSKNMARAMVSITPKRQVS